VRFNFALFVKNLTLQGVQGYPHPRPLSLSGRGEVSLWGFLRRGNGAKTQGPLFLLFFTAVAAPLAPLSLHGRPEAGARTRFGCPKGHVGMWARGEGEQLQNIICTTISGTPGIMAQPNVITASLKSINLFVRNGFLECADDRFIFL